MEQTNLINSTYRKKIDTIQNNVSMELQADNNIAKILCTKADSIITNYEALNGELKFNGKVCYCVTYINENGEFFTLQDSADFNGKIENENIGINFVPMFNSEIVELKVSSTSDEVKITSVVETSVDGLITETLNYYVNNNENIVTNSNFVNYLTLNSSGKLSFNLEENFEVKKNVNKLLCLSADVKILDYNLGTDYFVVEGVVCLNYSYEIGDENKELCSVCETIKFKEELEKEGITKEGELMLTSYINNCEIKAELTSNEDGSTININIPINVNYAYLMPYTSEVIVDAYSLKNQLNLNIESFKVAGKNIVKNFNEKIDGQFILDDDAPRIIKIVSSCCGAVNITNSFKENDNLVVEGIASVNVVYLEEDDLERLNSIKVEVPFSVENRCDEIGYNDELAVNGILKDVDVKCKKGKEINIDMEICLLVNAFNTLEEMAITNVEEGEVLSPKEACLQIYFAKKGNSLWDISKGLQCKPEQILDQNPDINLPLENDEKIVLFNNKTN